MTIQADLAGQLRTMMDADMGPLAMGLWLAQNADVVAGALDMSDDLVLIPEIDLRDPGALERMLAARA